MTSMYNIAMLDKATKARLLELMFYVIPDPNESIDDDVLAQSEEVGWEEAQQMKAEFRSVIASMDDHPDVRRVVLAALDDMDASSREALGNDREWMNVCDVMGRRIRRAIAPLLQ